METLINILTEIYPDVDIEACTTFSDDELTLDNIVTLVAEIDAEFDVAIPAEELKPENFKSVQALWTLIQRLLEEQNGTANNTIV